MTSPRAFISHLDRFQDTARRLGARVVLPRPDGSLLAVWTHDDQRAELIWQPRAIAGEITDDRLAGEFVVRGLDDEHIKQALDVFADLQAMPNPFPPPISDDPKQPIQLNRWFVHAHLTSHLEVGRSVWGPFRLAKVSENGPQIIRLHFEGTQPPLVVEIGSLQAVENDLATNGWHPAPPLALRVCSVPDTASLNSPLALKVLDYLRFALARSFTPDQPLQTLGTDDLPPETSQTKTSKQQAEFDPRDEIDPGRFFIGWLRPGATEGISTLFDDPDLAIILYGANSCCMKHPVIDIDDPGAAGAARFDALALTLPQRRVAVSNMHELDLILGDETAFRQALEDAIANSKARAVVVIATCVVDMIGSDLHGIVKMAQDRSDKPVLLFETRPQFAEADYLGDIWSTLFEIADPREVPKKRHINVIGLAAPASRSARTLRRELAELDLTVNHFFFPSFRLQALSEFYRAETSIIADTLATRLEFATIATRLPETHRHALDPPFGLAASLKFYRYIAELCGIEETKYKTAVTRIWKAQATEWEHLQSRAKSFRVLLVISPEDADFLLDPGSRYGLDLPAILLEMGFSLQILCLPQERPSDALALRDRLAQTISVRVPNTANLCFDVLADVSTLPEWLAKSDASLLFSEFPGDTRALQAGLLPLTPHHFEPGLAGARRTLRRLVRLAEASKRLLGKDVKGGKRS